VLELHHDKHHKAYVDGVNTALEKLSGARDSGDLSSIVGAYAGALKTKSLCTDGSCLAGSGTAVYTTTYTYDDFGRQCEVNSVSAAGSTILDSFFTYDQFNNLVKETSTSALDNSTDSNFETAYTYDGLKIFVDQASLLYLDGAEVDFVETLEGSGFKFNNPQVKSTCGCGSSFQV
jgi:Fe-S cluster assembly iron-binding protein IscA